MKKKPPYRIFKSEDSDVPIVEVNDVKILNCIYYSDDSCYDEEWNPDENKTPKKVHLSRFNSLTKSFENNINHMSIDIDEDEETKEKFIEFCKIILDEINSFKKLIQKERKKGYVSAEIMPMIFVRDDEVILDIQGSKQGALIESVNLINTSNLGQLIEINYKTIFANGKGFVTCVNTKTIPYYEGKRHLSSLGIRFMTAEDKKECHERGLKYIKYNEKPSYLYYTGNMIRKTFFGDSLYNANGRIMIDFKSMIQMDPGYSQIHRREEITQPVETLKENMIYLCSVILYGFSFQIKKWGEFSVDNISEIDFKSDAIEKLVLKKDTKELILAVVKNSKNHFSDIIDGKGGGSIFVLHGPPGTGKTLTAEAVAEYLKRPLYSISIGELGTNPQQLEKNLKMILNVATRWDAIILLDEADIFLEERDHHNIERNAMVGIFLRLLEYHEDVMFLTTNRIKNIDEAFHSRISMPIIYKAHKAKSRQKIWKNLLDAANINSLSQKELKKLANFKVNGRQIKNAIKTAIALAKDKNEPVVKFEHLKKTLTFSEKFDDCL